MVIAAITEDLPMPSGTVEQGRVLAVGLVSDDPSFVAEMAALSDSESIGAACQEAFELGVAVRRVASRSADVIYLGEQIQQVQERITSASEEATAQLVKGIKAATDSETGDLSVAVEREVTRLSRALEEAFDDANPESTLSQIRDAVAATVDALGADTVALVNKIIDPTSPDSPMQKISQEIARDVTKPVNDLAAAVRGLKETIEVRVAVTEERDKGTSKGFKYEEIVQLALEKCAQVSGDAVEALGKKPGQDGSTLAGDHVATLSGPGGAPIHVVFESKDRKLSLSKAKEELERACENRAAQTGVIVFSSVDRSPLSTPFMTVGPGRYIAVLDKENRDELALRVAYQSARIDALASHDTDSDGPVDVESLLAKVEDARSLLTTVSTLKGSLTKSARATDDATRTLGTLRTQLISTLDGLESMLHGDTE